jgi:hypothetical protein
VAKWSFKGCVKKLLPDGILGGYVANLKPKILREELNETFDQNRSGFGRSGHRASRDVCTG